jgi:hypothetical protein
MNPYHKKYYFYLKEKKMPSIKAKINMDSPTHQSGSDHKGGIVSVKKSPKFGKEQGKGTKSHFSMDTPDKAGGGWVEGKK